MTYATVTLEGKYLHWDGVTPAIGTVEITPSERIVIDAAGDAILTGRLTVELVAGEFSVELPATDDPTLNPTGFGYTVSVRLYHQNLPAVSLSLPAAVPIVDMSNVTGVDPSTFAPATTYVSAVDLAAVDADVTALETTVAAIPATYALLAATRLRVPRLPPAPVSRMFTADTTLGVWTVGGSAASVNVNTSLSSVAYTGDVLFGSKSIRVVSNGNGGGATAFPLITLTTPYDATNDDVRVWFKFSAADTVASINVDVRDSASTARSNNYYPIGGITDLSGFAIQPGRVNVIDLPVAALTGSGNLADTKSVRVTMTDSTGKPLDVVFYGLAFVKRAHTGLFPTGVLSITADDCHGSQWSVLRPALDNRGWRATLFPIIDQIDAPGNLTLAQVRSLHDDYGWEIAAHATTSTIHTGGLTALTQSQRLAEFEAIKKWQDAYGFDSPCLAYPIGRHSLEVERDAAQFFSVGRQALDQHIGPQYPANPYSLHSINAGSQGATLSTRLTQLAAGKGMESIVYHAIKESGLTGNDVTSATMATQLAAIASAGVTVLPMGEVIRTLSA